MSRIAIAAIAAVAIACGVALWRWNHREPPDGNPNGEGFAGASPNPAPAAADAPMKPGEVRPGEQPGTVVVQPFQAGGPKTISSKYLVPSHRDDARITRTGDGRVVFEQAIDLAEQLHSASVDPAEDVQILDAILAFYRLIYGMNPVAGENLEVVAALTGKNEHKIVVFPPDHQDIDDNGALRDRWGNPYFFHALSGTRLDILSNGPDGVRGTIDDISLGLEIPSDSDG